MKESSREQALRKKDGKRKGVAKRDSALSPSLPLPSSHPKELNNLPFLKQIQTPDILEILKLKCGCSVTRVSSWNAGKAILGTSPWLTGHFKARTPSPSSSALQGSPPHPLYCGQMSLIYGLTFTSPDVHHTLISCGTVLHQVSRSYPLQYFSKST